MVTDISCILNFGTLKKILSQKIFRSQSFVALHSILVHCTYELMDGPDISKGKYENSRNSEWCRILDEQTISKFANFWNFNNFRIEKNLKVC